MAYSERERRLTYIKEWDREDIEAKWGKRPEKVRYKQV